MQTAIPEYFESKFSGRKFSVRRLLARGAADSTGGSLIPDTVLFVVVLILVCFGLLMIYSTTAVTSQARFDDAYLFVRRQGIAVAAGLLGMLLLSFAPMRWLKKYSAVFLGAAILLLISVYIPGLGRRAGGALRWIYIAGVRFQPGELVKLCLVVWLAGYLASSDTRLKEFVPGVVVPGGVLALITGLYLSQPDFGSAVIICAIALCMMFVAGLGLRCLGVVGLAAVGAAALLVVAAPYRMKRLMAFVNPGDDVQGIGYQLLQSLIAVGSGELFGVGLGGSAQKLFFLPAAHTDFIFAVVGEELGFVGCLFVLSLFLLFLWRGIALTGRVADDTYRSALVVGCMLLVILPAMLNAGVVLGLLPTKGLVLPLIGYGGSSALVSLLAVGLMLAVARSTQTRS